MLDPFAVRRRELAVAMRRRQVLAGLAGATILTGCGTARKDPPPRPVPAVVAFDPVPGSVEVDPRAFAAVAVASGTLNAVEWIDETGRVLPGVLAADKRSWRSTEPLGYGHTYTAKAAAAGETGEVAATATCATVLPGRLTDVSLRSASLEDLVDGDTHGVGLIVVAVFDEPVDRVAAEQNLKVSTDPPVSGAWYWVSDRNAHWRPERYHRAGTTVTVAADLYGARLGDGLYGARNQRVSVTIGPERIAIADDNTKHVDVFENGQLVRSMPTSMGKGGTAYAGNKFLSFWTPPGVYTVLQRQHPVVMDSASYGLTGSGGYKVTINYGVRISHDGIFLHELASSVWAQGNTNVSHGCLNLGPGDAQWFYEFIGQGDVVEVRNTGGEPLSIWQGGDWGVPWSEWVAGSAPA
ncbi:L,D-transpeptidase [Nocardia goodfellowii]|uniref:Lipoprotein-anchoring transpeptidase ErfK/SrfK n=1 Tax=Nocardia goodfellowii TaxID=882446 RepID=A0ABS4QFS8_9NOCA|nr:Ig-like domain-containing protein [Nocardia goodfellowii]MBP2190559.1 lipoprotein-anchoring transpeptidase ErfK/SrfK [Nocardia goodfellowii]